jgi:CubicO group peptidase (beta-lactamase class C family)
MKPSALRAKLGKVVEAAMEKFDVPGVAVGIFHDGQEVTAGYGVTNLEFPLPVDEETLFQIGSTTKTFTATAIMQLVDEGQIDLEAPVRTYLPKFRVSAKELGDQILVRHLLTHTGGWLGDYFEDVGRGDDALRRIVSRMATRTPQLTPLGKWWSYNNAGFYVAGRLIEVLTGQQYESVIASRILQPLGMEKTFFFPEDVFTHKTALGHVPSLDGLKVARPWGLIRSANAAGGIVSNAPDQLRYARFHLGDGTAPDGTKVLSKESLDRMKEPLAPAGSIADAVGVSWLLEEAGGHQIVAHGGSVNGQMSAFAMVPAAGFAVTVLTNSHLGHQLDSVVVDWALETLVGAKKAKPEPIDIGKKKLEALAGAYKQGGVTLHLEPAGKRLKLTSVVPPQMLEEQPDLAVILPPPVRLDVVANEKTMTRVVAIDKPLAGRRGEFIRDDDGNVAWFRWGGRTAVRA